MGEDGKCNTRETYIGFTHHVDVRAHMKLKEDLSRFCDFVASSTLRVETLASSSKKVRQNECTTSVITCSLGVMPSRRSYRTNSEAEWNSEDEVLSLSDSDVNNGESASKESNGFKRSRRNQPRVVKKRKTEDQRQESAESNPGNSKTTDSMHSDSRHSILAIGPLRTALLEWYATVHDSRSMPWRKPPEDYETIERRSQRAYEVTRTHHAYLENLTCEPGMGFRSNAAANSGNHGYTLL